MFDFLKPKKTEVSEFNIICPKCMEVMQKQVKGDIIIDTCSKCGGLWLDKNEVEKLFEHMKNEEELKAKVKTEIAKEPQNQQAQSTIPQTEQQLPQEVVKIKSTKNKTVSKTKKSKKKI